MPEYDGSMFKIGQREIDWLMTNAREFAGLLNANSRDLRQIPSPDLRRLRDAIPRPTPNGGPAFLLEQQVDYTIASEPPRWSGRANQVGG